MIPRISCEIDIQRLPDFEHLLALTSGNANVSPSYLERLNVCNSYQDLETQQIDLADWLYLQFRFCVDGEHAEGIWDIHEDWRRATRELSERLGVLQDWQLVPVGVSFRRNHLPVGQNLIEFLDPLPDNWTSTRQEYLNESNRLSNVYFNLICERVLEWVYDLSIPVR